MKELLTDEVRALPSGPIPLESVMRDGRRRLWRHRAAGGTASFAAVAALALVAPSLVDWSGLGDDSQPAIAGAGAFEQREATYAKGSTIHYGDQEIDVSPHQVWSFVQTDDGFVFATEAGDVYLADGATVEQIGEGSEDGLLAADDTGSYVAWTDNRSEFVVYDTATRDEVTRTPADGDPVDGVWFDDNAPNMVAIDGDTAYGRSGEGLVAWDLATQSGGVLVAHENQFFVHDVADGKIAQLWTAGTDLPEHEVVSEDPNAARPRFPLMERADLSSTAVHVASGDRFRPNSRIYDVAGEQDVTPAAPDYRAVRLAQWIDDGLYVARALPKGSDQVDLLICSVADGTCAMAEPAVGSADKVVFPLGEPDPF